MVKKREECRICGKKRKLSKRGLCAECAKNRNISSVYQLKSKQGPYYDKWKEKIIKGANK